MKSILTDGRLACAVSVLQIGLLICAVVTGASCTRQPEAPLRVGTNVWPGYEPLYLARELGYYPAGKIKFVEYSSASEVLQAFRNEAIDAATLTLDEVILLAETTSDVRVVLVLDFSHGADVVMGQPSIASLRDLKGKRVGLEAGALGAYMLTRALETIDLTLADVHPVSLDISEHERAFKEGNVDAVVTFEPVKTKLRAVNATQLFDSSQIPGEIVDVLIVRRGFAEKNQTRIDELVRGWFRAITYLRDDSKAANAAMARRERISAGEFQEALKGLRLAGLDENHSMLAAPAPAIIPTARRLSQLMLDNKLIKEPAKLGDLFDGHFINGAHP